MKRTGQEKSRTTFFAVIVCLFFAVIFVRLIHLQVVLADDYGAIVTKQSSSEIPIPAGRGVLYDRQGRVVANNVFLSSIYVYPESKKELREITSYLANIFSISKKEVQKKYPLKIDKFRWIKRKISDKLSRKIENSAPKGVYLRKEAFRKYPFGQVGRQILGFTNIDNRGQSGFEYSFDSLLAGKQGWADVRRDGYRNSYRVRESALVKPVPGQSVVLTIDWSLQEIVEEELKTSVEKYKAKSAMAAFVDCNSGEILAMAHYDPSEKNPERPVKLRVVTDMWEPGSISKIFSAAALLDNNMIDFSDSTYCELGKWKVNRRILHDDKELEWLNFREIIELSSNIGLAKHAVELGGEEILKYKKKFGLGTKLLKELPGETSGQVRAPSRWSDYNIAALSIGHSIAVSTLQMAVAFASVANGGELLKPRLILGYVDEHGYVLNDYKRHFIRRTMKEETADSLKSFMRGVVERGTATKANSEAVSIAGKTGTAQIYDVSRGRYFRSKYMASFAGFFPYEHPLVAGIVVFEEPQPVHYGGWTAGPTFKNITEKYALLNPDSFASPERLIIENEETNFIVREVPNLLGMRIEDATMEATESGLTLNCTEVEGMIVWQYPSPDRLILSDKEILVGVRSTQENKIMMANLKGMALREATAFLSFAGIKYEVSGNGAVVKQSIKPGAMLSEKDKCKLVCKPI